MRQRRYVLTCLALVAFAATTVANHNSDAHFRMTEVASSPNAATHSDAAFWGNHAFVGYYTGDAGFPAGSGARGGVRIFDISNPANPTLLRDFACDGSQADPIVWDRNGNGVADLMLLAVDRTMANPNCGAPRAAHDDPLGWEGVRVFTLSDDPVSPFTTITQVAAAYTDCGAHSITLWPGETSADNLIVYVSSYPLRPGPTCGATQFSNLVNPYDPDKVVNNPLHGVVQVLQVPLSNPAATTEITPRAISYPGDPDGRLDWGERGVAGLEPAAVGCSSISVHVAQRLAAGACGEQGQVWRILEGGLPDTANPLAIVDDNLTSGGTGAIPGAVDFFDAAAFNNSGTVVTFSDESFGAGCPPMTTYHARPWNPAGGTHKTGRLFFADAATGALLNEFQVGDARPDNTAGAYCPAGRGAAVRNAVRDVLVSGWFLGGVNVLDFTNPGRLREIAYYDAATSGGMRSAYAYAGPSFQMGGGHPVYGLDGVNQNGLARGLVVFRATLENIRNLKVDHMNPQTVD